MNRTIKLSRNLTICINTMVDHHIANSIGQLSQDWEELRDMTHINDRFKLTVTLEDIIPECNDIILNLIVKEILCMADDDENYIDMMNGFYQYLCNTYSWKSEQDHLLKATTIEILEYCIDWVIGITS